MKRITRVKKKLNKIKYIFKTNIYVKIIGCIFLIMLIVILSDTTYVDTGIRCNQIKGEYCTKYEVEKMINNGQ